MANKEPNGIVARRCVRPTPSVGSSFGRMRRIVVAALQALVLSSPHGRNLGVAKVVRCGTHNLLPLHAARVHQDAHCIVDAIWIETSLRVENLTGNAHVAWSIG